MKWERTFELSVSPGLAWEAFSADETETPKVFHRENAYLGSVQIEIHREEPGVALEWTEIEGDLRWDMVATFTETDTGTSVTIVRSGFGDSDEWMQAAIARFTGWGAVMCDLEVFFRTGKKLERFYGTPFLAVGVHGFDYGGGVKVRKVLPDSLAESAGLEPGDIIVSIGGAPVYGLRELWSLPRVLKGELDVTYVRGSEVCAGRGVLSA